MNFPPPPLDNWDERIPGDENFEDTKQRLSNELQLAAMRLLSHLKVTSLRLRLAGSPHGIYLTIGGGRHTDEYPASGDQTATKLDEDVVPQKKMDVPHYRLLSRKWRRTGNHQQAARVTQDFDADH